MHGVHSCGLLRCKGHGALPLAAPRTGRNRLPPRATPAELRRRLLEAGLGVSEVRVELHPLSGDASGRGEVSFRNVHERGALLRALEAQPALLLGGRATHLTYDDTEPKQASK